MKFKLEFKLARMAEGLQTLNSFLNFLCACVQAKLLQSCMSHSLPPYGLSQPGDLPDPGIELVSFTSLAFPAVPLGKSQFSLYILTIIC